MDRLERRYELEACDFVELLELAGGYRVRRIGVDPGDWVEGRRLDDLKLFDEGITIRGGHGAGREWRTIDPVIRALVLPPTLRRHCRSAD